MHLSSIRKLIFSLIVIQCVTISNLYSQEKDISFVSKKIGSLNVSIDSRIELLTIIQKLANYKPLNNPNGFYSEKVDTFFRNYKIDKSIKMTKSLGNWAFSYDAPIEFVLKHSFPPELKKMYSYGFILNARGSFRLGCYEKAMRNFSKQSNYIHFFNENIAFYQNVIDYSCEDLNKFSFLDSLLNYYGKSYNSYNLVISPLCKKSNYSTILRRNDKTDVYMTCCTNRLKAGIPYCSSDMIPTIWHEMSHSYVNDLVDKNRRSFNQVNSLFYPIKSKMKSHAYPYWNICVKEHIVRAVTCRLTEKYFPSTFYNDYLKMQIENGFIYLPELLECLKVYEQNRAHTAITFDDYFPKILECFKNIEAKTKEKEAAGK